MIQAIGLGVYYAFLRNEKLFNYARVFLWLIVMTSLLAPLIQLEIVEPNEFIKQINQLPQSVGFTAMPVGSVDAQTINWYWIMISLAACISLIQLIRLFFTYRKIIILKKEALFCSPNIYTSEDISLPFSFLDSIYLPKIFLSKRELHLVLAHEQSHLDKKHSWDKIVITILARVFWFNPLFILFHKELELVHEYQVDETVTQEHSLEDYLNSLLQSTIYLQSSPIVITHSFFSSPIKNRIIMLHKKSKNQTNNKIITLGVLLALVFTVVFFQSQKANAQKNTNNQKEGLTQDTTFTDNSDGTYTMKYTNENGGVVLKVVPADKMLFFLNRKTDSNSQWSLGKDNGLILNTAQNDGQQNLETIVVKGRDTVLSLNADGSYNMRITDVDGKILERTLSEDEFVAMFNVKIDSNYTFNKGSEGEIRVTVDTENEVYKQVDVDAIYPGGDDALISFVGNNLNLTKSESKDIPEGVVYLEFVITSNGRVAKIKSVKTPKGLELIEKRGIEAVKKMPKWQPAKKDGKEVSSYFVLPIAYDPG